MLGFIINGASGNGKGQRIWKRVERLMKNKEDHYVARFTSGSQHVKEVVNGLVDQHVKTIIAVGGDGTVHHVANELAFRDISLGVIPAGSGNDFARCLGVPMHYTDALERILMNECQKVDLLHVGKQYCLTVTGIGLDGKVANTVNRSMYKRYLNYLHLGGLSYVISFLDTLRNYRPTNIELAIDGKKMMFSNVWLVAVANAPNYGGGIAICPDASYNDGFLDLCIVQGGSKWGLLNLFTKCYRGKHITKENVTMLRGKEVNIHSDTPIFIHSDGEPMPEIPVRFRIEKDALRVV